MWEPAAVTLAPQPDAAAASSHGYTGDSQVDEPAFCRVNKLHA